MADIPEPGLSFVDLLYAVPVAALATRLADPQLNLSDVTPSGWADVAVALTAITLGWMGHHTNRRLLQKTSGWQETDRPFTSLRFLQFIVEILIIVAYFALATLAVLSGPASRSEIGMAAWLAGVFVMYLMWDVLDIKIAKGFDDWKERAVLGMLVTRFFAFLFVAVFVLTLAARQHRLCTAFAFDTGAIVLLCSYRWTQETVCRKCMQHA